MTIHSGRILSGRRPASIEHAPNRYYTDLLVHTGDSELVIEPAETGRVDRHVRSGQSEVEPRLDGFGQLILAESYEALVVAVQAPDIVGMLVGARQLAVEAEICSIYGLGFLDPSLFEQ